MPVEGLKLPVFKNGNDYVYLKIPEAVIAAVNRSLVGQSFQVFEISRHASSLEDIYFRLTQC